MAVRKCEAQGCVKLTPPHGGRHCKMHRNRVYRWGSLEGLAPETPEHYAVLARIIKLDGCWAWDGIHNNQGYGVFQGRANAKNRLAHRIIYGYYYGEPPSDLQVDHMCGNRGCVNPDHLRAVTPKQNTEHFTTQVRASNTSGVRGVTWDKARKRWRARVESAGKSRASYHLRIEDAERAALQMRLEMHTHNDLDRLSEKVGS